MNLCIICGRPRATCGCIIDIDDPTCISHDVPFWECGCHPAGGEELIEAGNPVYLFFEYMFAMYQSFPLIIQALLGMVLLTTVFFGLMMMIRS
jgi:hypothetical protein